MHLLPTGLAKLADMADKHDSSRFALANVHLRVRGDNTFVAEATDTKALLRVSGPCPSEPGNYPTSLLPGFDEAPNGHTDVLVPASKWQKLFAAAGKLTRGKALNSLPVLRSVAVRVSEKVTTFGATDASQKLVETVENSPGRFPPAADILCSARRQADRVIAFDPRQLANLLSTMDAIIDDPDARVEFHVPRKPEHPMLVTGAMASGLKLDAVIMPLVPPKPTGAQAEEAEEPPEVVELQKQLGLLKARYEALEAERDQAMKASLDKGAEITRLREVLRGREDAIDELGRSLRAVEFNARGLVEDRDRLQIENARLVGKLSGVPVTEPARPAPAPARPLSRRERLQGA